MKRRLLNALVVLAMLAALVLPVISVSVGAVGNTYYVATTGNDSAAGTIGAPWLTIQHAADTVVAGDTVYIRAGTYSEMITPANSGTVGSPITYAPYTGESVVIDENGLNLGGLGAVYIDNKSYITFGGTSSANKITIENVFNYCVGGVFIAGTSDNDTLQNLYIQDTDYSGIVAGSIPASSTFGYLGSCLTDSGAVGNNPYFSIAGYTPIANGVVSSMSASISNSDVSNAHNISMAIYTESGGTYTKVAETGSVSIAANSAKAWFSGSLLVPLSVNTSTVYYLCVNYDNAAAGTLHQWCDAATRDMYTVSQAFGSWATTFTAPTLNWAAHTIGIYATYMPNSTTNVTIDSCELYHTNHQAGQESISIVGVNGFEVKNCSVHDTVDISGRIGIDAKVGCSNGSIHNNTVYNITNGAGIYIDGGYTSPPTNTHDINIYDNTVYRCFGALYAAVETGDANLVSIKYYNNLVYNNTHGFEADGGISTEVLGITIINNTFYHNGDGTATGSDILFYGAHINYSAIIRNNIFSEATSGMYAIKYGDYAGGGVTVDHNLLYNSGGAWNAGNVLGTSSVSDNPLLTSPTTDFSIPSGSPAKDVGSATGAPATDYIGTSRPQNLIFDIGAYEYIVGGTTTTTTTTTTSTTSTTTTTGITTTTPPTTSTPISTSIAQDIPIIFGILLIIAMFITAITTRSVSAVITATIICLLGIFGIVLLENLILSIFGIP